MRRRVTVEEVRLGAIYRFASKRSLSQPETLALLVERLGMRAGTARTLVGHWFKTEPLRPTRHGR